MTERQRFEQLLFDLEAHLCAAVDEKATESERRRSVGSEQAARLTFWKALDAVLTARDALTEECAGLRRGQDLVAGKLLELVAERDRLRAAAEGNA